VLQLTSRHEGGHITIDVVLDREITWTVTTELLMEPGEQLTAAARDLEGPPGLSTSSTTKTPTRTDGRRKSQ